MYFLEEMIEHTNRLLQEEERRKKALTRILHVRRMASGQREHTKLSVKLMLEYEQCRQKNVLEQNWVRHKISKEQKKEWKRRIQLYEEYVTAIMNKATDI